MFNVYIYDIDYIKKKNIYNKLTFLKLTNCVVMEITIEYIVFKFHHINDGYK